MSVLNNLVSYWPCESDFADIKRASHGAPSDITWKSGKIAASAYFNGETSLVTFSGTSTQLWLQQPFSYSFWIKAPATNEASTYLNINGDNGISINRASGTWDTVITVGGTENKIVSTQRIDTGEWNHVCIAISGTESKFYLNNVDTTDTCTIASGVYNNAPLIIGCTNSGVAHTEMYLDEFGIYDNMLTSSGVAFLYNNNKGISLNNNVLQFNGTTDIINCGTNTALCNLADFTIEAWVRADSTSADHHRIFSKESVVYVGRYGSQFSFYTGNGSTWTNYSQTLFNVQPEIVFHVAYVKEGTAGKLYINGFLEATVTLIATTGTNSGANTIGKSGAQSWDGGIYDLRLWSVARTQSQIVESMYKKLLGDEVGLIANYLLDSNYNSIAYDLKGNHGSITGTTITSFYNILNTSTVFYSNSISYSGKGSVSVLTKSSLSVINGLSFDGINDSGKVNPFSLPTLTNELTISFWAKVTSSLPINTYFLQVMDSSGNRVLNLHWPWGDGNIYWDAGNSGATYDRTYKAYTASDLTTLNYWSFVKNATTGSMKIYINGVLWHSATGKTYPMLGGVNLDITYTASYPWGGILSRLEFWNKELSVAEILYYRSNAPTGLEPNLVAYYKFNEGYGSNLFDHAGTNHGFIYGPTWSSSRPVAYSALESNDVFTVASGTNLTLAFNPDSFCTVSGIVINNSAISFPTTDFYDEHIVTIVKENDIDIYFRDLNQFIITPLATGSGTITPSGIIQYYEFDKPTYTFTPTSSGIRLYQYYINNNAMGNNDTVYTFAPLIEDKTIECAFASILDINGIVLTMQSIELVNTGLTLVSGSLTKGQNYTNCVPFLTQRCSSGFLYDHLVDVYFTDGRVYANKGGPNTNTSYVHINIVEFNPTKVRVTQGIGVLTGTTLNVTITAVDMAHTFLVFTYKSTSGSSNWSRFLIRGRISTTTNLEFYKVIADGTVTIHYYIIEALNNEFNVQTIVNTSAGQALEIPTEVAAHRTFIVASYASNSDAVYPDRSTGYTALYNNKETYNYKIQVSNNLYFNIQIIEIEERGKVFVNHNKYVYVASSVLTTIKNFPMILSGQKVMVHNPCNNQGINRTDGTSLNNLPAAFSTFKKISNSQYEACRVTTGSVYTEYSLQFIDWDGEEINIVSAQVAQCSNIVKSVENINTTFYSSIGEYYKYLPLTKNQNWKYCVPFCTYTSASTYHIDTKCNVDIVEGPILTVSRIDGHSFNCEVNISVVEFDPTTVYVEKGCFFSFSASTTVVVSGTTSSGVADLNRSAMQFTQVVADYSQHWSRTAVRGSFINNNTLAFYRGIAAGGMFGHYYIMEFLDGTIATSSSLTTSQVISNNGKMAWPQNRTIPLVSYYSTNDAYYADRSTIYYHHRAPTESYISRMNSSGAINASVGFVRFDNHQNPVERVFYYMDASTVSGSITLANPVNPATTTVLNSNQLSVGRTSGTTTPNIPGAYVIAWIDPSGNYVFYKRAVTGAAIQDGFFYIVDWGKDYAYTGPYKEASALVSSIESVVVNFDGIMYKDIFLTKKQNANYCVPFVTSIHTTETALYNMFFIVDIEEAAASLYRNWYGTGPTVYLTIVEFNPKKAKVCKYYFSLIEVTTTTVTIDVVDITKAFIVVSFCTNQNNWGRSSVRAYFTNSTTISLYKAVSYGNMWGTIYVVESLDDSFTVDSYLSSGAAVTVSPSIGVDMNNTSIIVNYTTNSDAVYTDRGTARMLLTQIVPTSLLIERFDYSNTIYTNTQFIIFKSGVLNKANFLSFYMDSTTSSASTLLSYNFNPSTTVNFSSAFGGVSLVNGTTSAQVPAAFQIGTLTNSGTTFSVSRGITGSNASYSSFNLIDFDVHNYYFEGTVKEDTDFVNRTVALYRRSTNELIDTATSSGSGGYRLESPYADEHYIVCLDDSGGIDYNALIIDRALGIEIFPLE